MAYMTDTGGGYRMSPGGGFTGPILPPDPWAYPITAHTPGVESSSADPWMNTVPGLVNYPPATANPPTSGPTAAPRYNLGTDPGVIYANWQAKLNRDAANRAHQIRLRQMRQALAGRGLGHSGEVGYQTDQEGYSYGQGLAAINNAPFQAYLNAWQYAKTHPELYSGVTGLPPELGG